ncbi:unnamed protein product [Calypogeia fissa]
MKTQGREQVTVPGDFEDEKVKQQGKDVSKNLSEGSEDDRLKKQGKEVCTALQKASQYDAHGAEDVRKSLPKELEVEDDRVKKKKNRQNSLARATAVVCIG